MLYSHLERIRSEIESAKQTILNTKVIKSMEDYYYRTGYLTGLQKAIELFSEPKSDMESD